MKLMAVMLEEGLGLRWLMGTWYLVVMDVQVGAHRMQ